MGQSETFKLPHGARGIEFDDFAMQLCRDKALLLRKSAGEHYTVHAGIKSGVLDIHRTWIDENGKEQHKTVFAMRRDDIPLLLGELTSLTTGFMQLIRRLRLGWLVRQNIGIVRGLYPVTARELGGVTRKGRHKRLVFDEEKGSSSVYVPEYLEEVFDFPDGPFSLFKGNRQIGIGIKRTDHLGNPRLFWLRLRDLTRFFEGTGPQLIEIASRYAIPPDKYRDYSVLVP